jgi:hypothetical protein
MSTDTSAPTLLTTTQEVLDYLKTTRYDTIDLSRCVKPHMLDVLLQLFLRINWMKTWFRTNHTSMMYKADSPLKDTVEFFKEVSEEDFPIVFAIWCLHLVNKFPIDSAYEVAGKFTTTTEDYDKQNCILNIVSDIYFHPAAKAVLLDKTYIKDLEEVLMANLIRVDKGEFKLVTNPMLAKEICTQVYFRAEDVRNKMMKAATGAKNE